MKKALFSAIFILGILSLAKTYSQELHTQANAANPTNEGNSAEGWGGNTNNTSISNEVYNGNYGIKLEALTDGWRLGEYIFTTVPGERYKITIYAKSGTPVRQGFYTWEGFDDFVPIDNIVQEWTEYTWTLTASGTTGKIKIFTGHPSVAGNTIYIDNISITKEDLQAPAPPTLWSIAQATTGITLTWNGATDNIGVTSYKIYKNSVLETTVGTINTYEITGLTPDTAYHFTIKSVDAYGNESNASNEILGTTDSGNSGGVWTSIDNDINYTTGNVGIGTAAQTSYRLAVDGHIHTKEVKVDLSGWADYVFTKEYQLPTLEEVKKHINERQ